MNDTKSVEVTAEDVVCGGNKKKDDDDTAIQCVSKYIGGVCHKDENDFQGEKDITDQDDG